MDNNKLQIIDNGEMTNSVEEPQILEEIVVEELAIDGICGVY